MGTIFLNGIKCKELGKRVWQQLRSERIPGHAAQLSFYFLLSIFPLLIFAMALLGYLLEVRALLSGAIEDYLRTVAPRSVTGLLNRTLNEIAGKSSGGKISLGLLASLWVGSSGMLAIIKSLNAAYEVKEFRPWWKRRLLAIALAVSGMAFVVLSLVLLVYGGHLIQQLGSVFNLAETAVTVWKVLQWPIMLSLISVSFYGIYYFGPNVKHVRKSFLVPGTVCAVLAWLIVSFGFKLYLLFFNRYNVTYGSIGAVIILLLWFYFTGMAILLGVEALRAEFGDQILFDSLFSAFTRNPPIPYSEQIAPSNSLLDLKPKGMQDLQGLIRASLSGWNSSTEQLPYYFREVYSLEAVCLALDSIEVEEQLDEKEHKALQTYRYWLHLP